MTRLASTVKAHFFPTPLALIPAIAALIEAPLEGGTIFDPCAGTGETVAALGALLGLRAGGNELDATRAEEARTRLAFCTTGPYDALTVKQSGAQVVFLNPPYADDKSRARLEVQSLAPALRCLAPGGVLIAVVPRQVALSAPFLQTLGAVCDLRGVRRFPDGDVEAYDQVVIWGQRRHKRAELATEAQLRSVLHDEFRRAGVPGSTYGQTSTLPVLRLVPATPCTVYPTRLPLIVENTLGDPAAFLALSGGKLALRAPAFRTLTIGARVGGTSVVPILPIRPAHSAALLAAGLVDGAEVTHRGAAVLVRGSTVKTVITREEDLSDTQIKLVHREKFAGRLTLLDLATGVLTVLDESNPTHRDAYEAFVTEQFDTLSTLLVERYPARFVPGVSVDAPIVARVLDALYFAKPLPRQVTPGLLPKQREVVSGIVHTLRTARHAVVAEAEMSSGKGSMGTAIAAATDAERLLAGTWRTVIVGPAHLAKKWQRELTSILAAFDVRFTIARTVGDVDAAFAHEGNAAVFLTREAGKMGMKWRQAFAERNVHTIVEERVHGVQKRVRYSQRVAACPDCGAVVPAVEGEPNSGAIGIVDRPTGPHAIGLDDQRQCEDCGAALWQCVPYKGGRTGPVQGPRNASRFTTPAFGGGKVALAHYIATHYTRQYFFIDDEIHESAAMESDQGFATARLASSARKTLGLTGTFYGGRASSVFPLAYRLFPEVRQDFAYSDRVAFSSAHGTMEYSEVVERAAVASTYGYARRGTARAKEVPGTRPSLIAAVLPGVVFLDLAELGAALPRYHEYELTADLPREAGEAETRLAAAYEAGRGEARKGRPALLSQWVQCALGWPYAMERSESLVGDDFATSFDGLEMPEGGFPLDQKVVAFARERWDAGERTLIYVQQTRKRDASPRLQRLLQAAGLPTAIMSADAVKPEAREAWMAARVAEGIAVVLVNPHLVRVGLDLVDFPSIVCFGIDHQMRRLSQSIRRAWRITQEKDCRVVFARYNTTPLNAATALTAAKLQAAARFAGRSADGLAASATEDADDLLGALLRHLDRGTAADLRGGFTAYPLTTEASVPRAPVAAIVPVAVAPIGPRPPEDPAGPDRQMALFMA